MDLPTILPYAVLGLLGIILLVMCILGAKAWKIVHIMMLILVFIALGATIILMSSAFRTRSDWINRHNENLKLVDQKTKEYNEALYGPDGSIKLSENSLLGLSALLEEERVGQGRVWRLATPQKGTGEQIVFTFPDSPAGTSDQISEDMKLFAFRNQNVQLDNNDPNQLTSVPVGYVATVRVLTSANGQVTVDAQFIADPAAFADPKGKWTLFERMPVDTSGALRRAFKLPEDPSSPDVDPDKYIDEFRTKFIGLFPKPDSLSVEEYETLVDQFAFDGMRVDHIKDWIRKNNVQRVFDPSPQELHHKVVFAKKFTTVVDDVSNQTLNNNTAIDPLRGVAIDPALKANEDTDQGTVSLNKDESAVFDSVSVTTGTKDVKTRIIENDADAQIDATIFKRKLIDFPYLLDALGDHGEDLVLQTARLQENIRLSKQSNADLKTQTTSRNTSVDNLETDNKNLTEDLKVIREMLNEQQRDVDNMRQRINDLYADISRQHADIARKSRLMLQKKPAETNGGQ